MTGSSSTLVNVECRATFTAVKRTTRAQLLLYIYKGKYRQAQTNVESFTLTAKRNAISENLSFLL